MTTFYRFITAKRRGKWYPVLEDAQRYAERIGAGFMDAAGNFTPYRGTILEFCEGPPDQSRSWSHSTSS
ncbi:hypothetical protein VCJ71_03070 [Alteriqipengyuania sp. WL0013]|nr:MULTISPECIES: hypothetical protein [Alteriqipengyuania]MEB3415043.1 hypothetical protein [Alteriqipengyuania sp. WL0013]WJY18362.1 hypothetical protein QQW98_12160 [Alteriqipengyuania flavescens]WJY24303.1 hypothetical protein QQS45_12165 [Alteriqipengyuania flavescens]